MAPPPRSHVTLRPDAVTFDGSARPPAHRTYAFDFKTESVLGEGGMGRVFAARDQRLGRKVAIKELRAEVRERGELWGRFVREAQIGGQLEHPNIVPIYGFEFSPDGGPAFVMQLIEGESLATYLERARSTDASETTSSMPALKERLAKLLPVADAIAYAHGRGVLHRDLKPDNIMLGPHNVVMVTDWGIARVESDEADADDRLSVEGMAEPGETGPTPEHQLGTSRTLVAESGPAATAATLIGASADAGPTTRVISRPVKTALGAVLGTAPYMSPEQARGLTVGPPSDQYALGLILLELATLRTARNHEDTQIAFNQAIHGEQCTHVDLQGQPIDARLTAIIARATAEQTAGRYPSVEAFARDVRAFLVDEEVSVAPDSRARKLVRSLQRHPGRSVAALALILLVLAGLALSSLWQAATRAQLARADSQALSQLTSLVLADAQGLDRYLLGLDSELVGLAEVTRVRLEQAPVKGERAPTFFTPRDFAFGMVPGSVKNHVDGRLRSYREPVFVFLPGNGREAHDAAARLALGKADLISLYLENIDAGAHKLDAPAQEALMASDHDGLVRLMVALESGLFVQFPGFGDFPTGYDPRTAAWYARATLDRGSAFTRPKYGPRGQTPRILLVRAVRSSNRVIGAAASGIWLKTLVARLGKHSAPGMSEVFVAGKDGKEIVSPKVLALALSTPGGSEAPVDLPDVSSVKLRRALGGEHAQGFVIDDKALFVYSRLAAEDWILVHRYDRAQYLALVR